MGVGRKRGIQLPEDLEKARLQSVRSKNRADEKVAWNSSGYRGQEARRLWAIHKTKEAHYLKLKAEWDQSFGAVNDY